jgi:hypothetical protein
MQAHQKRGLAISAIGLTAMLLGGVSAADFRYRIAPGRFMVAPMNIVTNADESRIVVGSMWAKVHVLDANGRPQARWQLPRQGDPFRIALPSDDRIQVATQQDGLLLEYDMAGELLTESADLEAYQRIGPANEREFTAASGARYWLDGGRILRSQAGAETVLVDGFASHQAITLRLIGMALALFGGAFMLVAGFVSTGRARGAD